MKNYTHQPVLLKEVVKILCPSPGKVFIDGTLGLGGHSKKLAQRGACIIALDRDKSAINKARENLKSFSNIKYIHTNFVDIDKILNQLKIKKVDGILLDLGVSSMQFDDEKRGFSFKGESLLDMRMDKDKKLTAEEIVNGYSEERLIGIFSDFGEERYAKRIAWAIIDSRQKRAIESTSDLVEIIRSAVPSYRKHAKTHFATNVFRALRMEVNNEVDDLITFMGKAYKYVKPGGIIVIISFHSIEDRIAKRGLKELQLRGKVDVITKKPIVPKRQEIVNNPRSRSAKLRACEVKCQK